MSIPDLAPLLERFVKVETSHQINAKHTNDQLKKLVAVTETMATSMSELIAQHAEVTRLGVQMRTITNQLTEHQTSIALLREQTAGIREIEKRLESAVLVTSGARWFAGVVVAALVVSAVSFFL